MTAETLSFEAEVSKLLHIVTHSLYSEKEIFLRELISNASDACDRLRYLAITEPELTADDPDLKVTVTLDAEARTLSVADNGIGMNRDELIENLGTIARSGSGAFVEQLTGDAEKDLSLIGQFGVGFYSAFMVADQVEVVSRRAGEEQAWRWQSDGSGSYTVEEAAHAGRGTTVTLHLRADAGEFADLDRLRHIVRTYSDHIALPIELAAAAAGEGEAAEPETVNRASAIWTRPKSEIEPEQYAEFYRHLSHGVDEPWATVHARAEGKIEYAMLLFVPSARPFDLFNPERKHRVKLYVKRVFITDDCEGLVPGYLRFLTGVVDSEDLPLNVSRELLQNNLLVAKIRGAVARRVLTELEKKAADDAEAYGEFWDNFGAVLKEGIYEDLEMRERLLKLARFRSTERDGLVSLADYVGRMAEGQQAIYYMTGPEPEALAKSPQLEGFAAKGVEVLLLADPVDDFWLGAVEGFEDKPFMSVTRGAAELDGIAGAGDAAAEEAADAGETGLVIAALKQVLEDEVKDVRRSTRLKDSPVCLVADVGDMDMHLERLLRAHKQLDSAAKRILEINPRHPVIVALARRIKADGVKPEIEEAARLLLDQARIVEGEPLADAAAFSRRMADFMAKGLGG